jgi:hypothetical protein
MYVQVRLFQLLSCARIYVCVVIANTLGLPGAGWAPQSPHLIIAAMQADGLLTIVGLHTHIIIEASIACRAVSIAFSSVDTACIG